MRSVIRSVIVAVTMTTTLAAMCLPDDAADAAAANGRYRNCTAYHKYYPHGVGKKHAHDHTSGKQVTNFKRSTTLYLRAVRHNPDLDRDRDGIACEKA